MTTAPEESELRAAVLRRLDLLDELAEPRPAELPAARTELHRLADGWRLLLEMHQAGPDGHCVACPGTRRHRRWPCGVWLTARRHLLDE